MHDNAVVVVVCPLNSLIECHIQELANQGIATCSVGVDGLLKDGILRHSMAWNLPAKPLIVPEERWRNCYKARAFKKKYFWFSHRRGLRTLSQNGDLCK